MIESLKLVWFYGKHMIALYLTAIIGLVFFWDSSYLIYTFIGYILFGMVGVEMGLHRYYSHRSFTVNSIINRFIYVCSIYAASGDPIYYAGLHRTHHRTSDTEQDPHRPHDQPFLSWLHCNNRSGSEIDWKIVKDLTDQNDLIFLAYNWYKIYWGTILITFLINPKFSLFFFVLPGIIVLGLSGLLNTINHLYGYRNFDTRDTSTNNVWVSALTFGGGLHNNHHANPRRYTNRVNFWEIDIAGWCIKRVAKTVRE